MANNLHNGLIFNVHNAYNVKTNNYCAVYGAYYLCRLAAIHPLGSWLQLSLAWQKQLNQGAILPIARNHLSPMVCRWGYW
ncbi:hypothetical protein J4727_13220 [Providencia rettgeri]|uniref:Uncharacterized protein n=1 Tax=Providencia rettgeri TaxID=587 RepID=A0A939NGK4_PRORE|nr:hypothetical protein [Providencia rettgeri]